MIGREDEQSNIACGTNIKQEQMLRQVRTKMDMDTQSLTAVIIQIPLIHLRK